MCGSNMSKMCVCLGERSDRVSPEDDKNVRYHGSQATKGTQTPKHDIFELYKRGSIAPDSNKLNAARTNQTAKRKTTMRRDAATSPLEPYDFKKGAVKEPSSEHCPLDHSLGAVAEPGKEKVDPNVMERPEIPGQAQGESRQLEFSAPVRSVILAGNEELEVDSMGAGVKNSVEAQDGTAVKTSASAESLKKSLAVPEASSDVAVDIDGNLIKESVDRKSEVPEKCQSGETAVSVAHKASLKTLVPFKNPADHLIEAVSVSVLIEDLENMMGTEKPVTDDVENPVASEISTASPQPNMDAGAQVDVDTAAIAESAAASTGAPADPLKNEPAGNQNDYYPINSPVPESSVLMKYPAKDLADGSADNLANATSCGDARTSADALPVDASADGFADDRENAAGYAVVDALTGASAINLTAIAIADGNALASANAVAKADTSADAESCCDVLLDVTVSTAATTALDASSSSNHFEAAPPNDTVIDGNASANSDTIASVGHSEDTHNGATENNVPSSDSACRLAADDIGETKNDSC